MIERSETSAPHSPEARIPQEPSYEIKRRLAFLLDSLYEIPILQNINFRIDLKTINRLRKHIGNEYVDDLEKALVNCRWNLLRGLAVKMGGQTLLAASLSAGVLPPEFYTFLFGVIAGGDILEKLDKDTAYTQISQAAMPVIQKLLLKYSTDMYYIPIEKTFTLVQSLSEAIAKGETFSRPELTTIIYTVLNAAALAATNQIPIGAILAAVELGVLAYIKKYLENGAEQIQSIDEQIKSVASITQSLIEEKIFDVRHARSKILLNQHTPSTTSSKYLQVAFQIGTQFILPSLAIFARGGSGLALASASQLGSYVGPILDSEREIYRAQDGVNTLNELLSIIERHRMSLTTNEGWKFHCEQFKEKSLPTVGCKDPPSAICVLAPFSLQYPRNTKPHLEIKEALEFRSGLYILPGKSQGESPFLHAITQQIRTRSKQESVVRFEDEKGISSLVGIHSLSPYERDYLFKYVSPETSASKLSPLEIFAEDLLLPCSVEFNPYIHNLLIGYKNKDELTLPEQRALGYLLQRIEGLKTEEQVATEVSRLPIPREEKSLILQLLPYARINAKEKLIKKLMQYNFFSPQDFGELSGLKPGDTVTKSLRAKLRVIKIIEEAQRVGTKVIAIDNTLDPISNQDSVKMIAFLGEWSKEHHVTILIGTTDKFNRRCVLKSPLYQASIFFNLPDVRMQREEPKAH